MTYKKLYEDALFKLEHNKITLGEFEEMTKPLDREVEQEPTDKIFTKADIDAIIKAINKGWELRVNEVLDKIRTEIEDLDIFYDNDYFSSNKDAMFKRSDVLQIIDKYRAESED